MDRLVTVFGGSGFLGGAVVRALARDGWRVRVAVRRPHRGYRLRPLGNVGQIELVQGDVRDTAAVGAALDGAQAAVNLVGVLYESGKQTFEGLQARAPGVIAGAAAGARDRPARADVGARRGRGRWSALRPHQRAGGSRGEGRCPLGGGAAAIDHLRA
jgi:uncharacterized protein YbjT (DUF2867 family)